MGDAAAPIPPACTAECDLQCDVWVGRIKCPGGRWDVYGGFTGTAGMQLDRQGAVVESRVTLPNKALLRSGISPEGQFCATVARDEWNWQVCGPSDPIQRQSILRVAEQYRVGVAKTDVIECTNSGC
jgi:hypothetical protein